MLHRVGMPKLELRKELYEIYCAIFNACTGPNYLSREKQEYLLDSVFACEHWSWRVVGISQEALEEFSNKNFEKKPRELPRDHFICKRVVTRKRMLAGKKPMSQGACWKLFWKNDQTVILASEKDKSKVCCFADMPDWEQRRVRYFHCLMPSGFAFRKTVEGKFLRELHRRSGELQWDYKDTLANRLRANPCD